MDPTALKPLHPSSRIPLLVLLLQVLLLNTCASHGKVVDHVVVISIDGLSPRYYTKEGTEKLFPTLEHFTQRGSYANGVIGVLPTLTFPSHTTLVTGATPALHGISSNLLFDPLKRNQGGWNWFAEDIKADTLWKAAARKGLKTGSVFWPVTVGARIDYLIPAFWRIGDSLDSVRLLRAV